MIKEFKEFISRGSVVDLAVGVIMGSAFGKIVSSLVNDIMMPFIGVILGGINFSGLTLNVGAAVINYGMFIQNIIDFLIISICIFVFIKFINRLSKPKKTPAKEEVKVEAKKADDVLLLEEIRDLLKLQNKKAKTNPKK